MARIIAPNKQYAGVSAGVHFTGGEGHTDNEYLIKWFRDHGYEVINELEADSENEANKKSASELADPEAVPETDPEKVSPVSELEEAVSVAPAQKKSGKKEK